MTVTVAVFREDFPEFSATPADATVTFWLTVATNLVDPAKFGALTNQVVELATAHYLSLAARNAAAAAAGKAGASPGLLASKAAGGLAASYDTGVGTIEGEGHWNLTTYGTQFVDLRNMFGAGGLQL